MHKVTTSQKVCSSVKMSRSSRCRLRCSCSIAAAVSACAPSACVPSPSDAGAVCAGMLGFQCAPMSDMDQVPLLHALYGSQ